MIFVNASIALFLIGIIGAKVVKEISTGSLPWWAGVIVSVLSGIVWGYLNKNSFNLIKNLIVFNIVYSLAYLCGFALLGERLGWTQLIGFAISIFGVIVMNLR